MRWKLLLFCLVLSSFVINHWANSRGINGSSPCAVCTVAVGLLEQYVEVHNVTIIEAVEYVCDILPREYFSICHTAIDIFGVVLIYLMQQKETPDVICYSLNFCHIDSGHQMCHLFPLPSHISSHYIKKIQHKLQTISLKNDIRYEKLAPCDIPGISRLCDWLKKVFLHQTPGIDRDDDLFSTYETYRGSTWRGKDCNDFNDLIYPGRRPLNQDINEDSNCNGIHGVNPNSGIPYETEFCSGFSTGFITIGDSISAHFHLPPQWFNPAALSKEILQNLTFVLTNEGDWPHLSYATGFENNTWPIVNGLTDSVYLRLKERNRCIHRDFQNLAVNGAMTKSFINIHSSLKRNKTVDNPALVLYALQGNDVCNSHPDTLKYVTPPKVFRQNVLITLSQLDEILPKKSQILLMELIDGSILYNALAKRYHPIGYLHKDVTYADIYEWFNCMEIGPCAGWQTPNATLRYLLTEKAQELSAVLKDIAAKYKFESFGIHYVENPFKTVIKEWTNAGKEIWQLIEIADGLHPNQIAHSLVAKVMWEEILHCCSDLIGEINEYNEQIFKIFGDQGGY